MIGLLRGVWCFRAFMAHTAARNARIEEDLVDQLFPSTGALVGCPVAGGSARKGQPSGFRDKPRSAGGVVAPLAADQWFMNKFRKLGFIEYNGGLHIHSSLLNVLLHDKPAAR